MSRLSYWGRPWVIFDVTDKQHRRWFAEFQRTRTWGHCPVRFIVDEEQGNLITMMQQQMIDYYISKEFKETNDSKTIKAQRKPRKKHVSA
jgi:hypothetical protein